MANSVVKVTDVTDDMINDSLLLLVGEDGTVTPDRRTVEKLLNSKSGPTNLQIMHIDKCDPKGIDVIVDNVTYIPDNMEVINEEDIIAKGVDYQDVNVVAVNLYNINLDHDYTPLTSPKRMSPAQEEDELAKTLSILHGNEEVKSDQAEPALIPLQSSKAPASKANKTINIISSITIPAPKSPATFSQSANSPGPTTSKEEIEDDKPTVTKHTPKGKAKILHTTPKQVQKKTPAPRGRKPVKKVIREEESSSHEEDDEDDAEEESVSEEEEEEEDDDEESEDADFSLELEDDDNDSDFVLEEEKGSKKLKKPSRKAKTELKKVVEQVKTPKIHKLKTPKALKPQKTPKLKTASATGNIEVPATGKGEKEQPSKRIEKVEESEVEKKDEKEPEAKPEEVKPEKKPPKKKKEPPKPIPGDFVLFSTPDIIRKVGGKDTGTPSTIEATPSTPKNLKATGEPNKLTTITKPDTPTSSKPGKIIHASRSKSTSEAPGSPTKQNRLSLDDKNDKEKHHSHHQRASSAESKNKDRRESLDKHKHSKSTEEKHSNETEKHHAERRVSDSNAEQKSEKDRKGSESNKPKHDYVTSKYDYSPSKHSRHSSDSQEAIPSAEDIRAIIMNEDTKTYTTNTIPIPESPVQLTSQSEPSTLNMDASGLDLDQSILDNINNDMISEDILYKVAQHLVSSNTELQNAIDKGINEGVLDTSGIQEMDISQMSQSSNSSFSESHHSDVIREATKIIRPDGRVLVLPPIERPTTRSRNRKKEEPVVKPSFKTVHKPLDEEHVSGNELDSSDGEEEESEDDPNKLWCICNQPHNNRFMICCDTCEEWYHGKCVNITKAMGQQMEAEGKEWICLFCQDPSLKRPMAAARRIRKASRNSRQSDDSGKSSSKKNETEKVVAASVPCVVCQKSARKNSIYCSEKCILTHAQGIEKVVVFDRASGNMLTGNKAPTAANLDQWLKQHPGYEVVRSAGKIVTTKVKPGEMTQSKLKLIKNPNNEGVSLAVQQKGVNVGVLKHTPKKSLQLVQSPAGGQKQTKIIKIIQKEQKEPKIKLIQPQPIVQPVKVKEQPTPVKQKVQVQTMLAPKLPVATPPLKTPKKELKEQKPKTPKSKPKEDATTPQPKQENIRDNVQKTIYEQLLVRLKGSDVKLTDEEVKNISIEIESELYKCFGDTGQKYKTKYRSLIFNIKDTKNQTLWRRICEKTISSYELVRLSPDDMASQELAKWREQEAKHQLDMIKKSEIELLNCNRQYVLKTHKGEEVLEDKRPGAKTDNTEIIKSLTEGSTLGTVMEPKRANSKERDKDRDRKNSSKYKAKEKDRHSSKERRDKEKEHKSRRSTSKEKERSRKRSRSRDKSRHEKKKKRSRSRSRDKSRERDRSKEREKNKDKYRKSSHKSSRQKKAEVISSTDVLDKRSKEILEQLNKIAPPVEDRLWKHVPQEDIVPANAPADSDSDHEVPTSTVTIPTPPRIPDAEDFPSQSSDDSKTSSKLKDIEEEGGLSPPPKSTATTELWSGTINMVDVAQISITAHEVSGDCTGLSNELTENLDIVGRISPDTVWDYIGKMRISNSKIISLIRLNATNIEEQMPYLALYSYLSSRNRLGVVKSTNKAIKDFYILPLASQKPIPQALLPINGPGFEEARPALLLGIIVRDKRKRSYLDPLPSVTPHKKTRIEVHVVPTHPLRSYTPPPMPVEVAPAPLPPLPPPPKVDPRLARNTPPPLPTTPVPEMVPPPSVPVSPGIPKLAPSIMSIVQPPKMSPSPVETTNDDDEPYSPEDSDPDTTVADATPPPSILTTTAISITQATINVDYPAIPGLGEESGLSAKKMDIQRQMEELNKKIEMQKSEITSITKNIATAESEIVGSALASIALPSNLQQILDSIKVIGSTGSNEQTSNEAPPREPPPPPDVETDLTIPLMIPKTFSRPLPPAPPPDLSLPLPNLSLPPPNLSLPPPNLSLLPPGLSLPPPDLSHPPPNMAMPPPDLSSNIPLNLPIKPKASLSTEDKAGSVLSSLSEEDLIKKAAEMLKSEKSSKREIFTPPLPPQVSFTIAKKPKLEVSLPPVPGLDD